MKRCFSLILAGLLLSGVVFAQENRSSVSVNLIGNINKSSVTDSLDQVPTNSGGFLANYRLDLSRHNAIDINYAYSRNTQYYASGAAQVQAAMHETTAAYVFKMPYKKFTPFVTGGIGALLFNPSSSANNYATADTQVRAGFLYGGGLDYNLAKHVSLRAQYRGLIYKAPNFGVSELTTDSTTHTAQPTIGLVLHF